MCIRDSDYYDDTAFYMNHSTGDFLNVTLHDGTWEYSLGKDTVSYTHLDVYKRQPWKSSTP